VPRAKPVDPNELSLSNIAKHFSDEEAAWELVERLRWPVGPVCPHCGVINNATYLTPKSGYRKTRTGNISYRRVWQCREEGCGQQFSVLIGTVMKDSKIPLSKWLLAMHLMCSGKNGISAHELHRTLGITYKSAWFMAHRIRYAVAAPPQDKLSGIVEADETYVGGKQKRSEGTPLSNKTPVFTLVQRNGEAHSQVMHYVTGENVGRMLHEQVDFDTRLMTDESAVYRDAGRQFDSHETVKHSQDEYVRGDVYTNTAEGYFSQLKRSIDGTYHHVSEHHLHRYLSEFDFRYNARKIKDGQRTERAFAQVAGKRLMYRDSLGTGG
jgi:transposase-like protein